MSPRRSRTLAGLGLALALAGCNRGQTQAEAGSGSTTADSSPGLRSAAPLPGVRDWALPDAVGGSSPSLASIPGADAIELAWMSDRAGTSPGPSLKLARLSGPGVEWDQAEIVVANARLLVNWADVPAIGHTPSGRTVLAWPEHHQDDPGEGYGVRVAAIRDDGSVAEPWSPDDVQRGPESGFAKFVTTPAGLRLFWLDGRELGGHGGDDDRAGGTQAGTMQLRSVAIDDDGEALGPSEILDDRTCECCKLGVGSVGEQPFAAYRDRSDVEIRDVFTAGPGRRPSAVAADGWTITGCPVNGPAVASVGARAAVAWFTGAEGRSATWIASTDNLDAFDPPIRFDLGLPSGRVDLLGLSDGDVLISWLELDPANPGLAALLARRLGPDGRLGPAFAVAELGAARDWGFPRAAELPGSPGEVLWVFTDPTGADGRPRLAARAGPVPVFAAR